MSSLVFSHSGSNSSSTAATSLTANVTINLGDTVVVAVATVGTAITAPTDNAGNVYKSISSVVTNTDSIQLWMASNVKAAAFVVMHCTSSRLALCVATYTGASTFGNGSSTTNSGTALSLATTQQDAAAFIVTGFAHVGVGTFSSNVGNLRVSVAGAGASTPGVAIVDNTGTAGASITTSTTQTGSTAWAAVSAELQTAVPLPMMQGADPSMMAGNIGVGF